VLRCEQIWAVLELSCPTGIGPYAPVEEGKPYGTVGEARLEFNESTHEYQGLIRQGLYSVGCLVIERRGRPAVILSQEFSTENRNRLSLEVHSVTSETNAHNSTSGRCLVTNEVSLIELLSPVGAKAAMG
jgi:hypothetical protein